MFSGILTKIRYSKLGENLRLLFPDWLVNLFWHGPKAIAANLYFRFPSRKLYIIGVTGTDGKTTTSTLIYKILLHAGKKAALISTVCAKIGQEKIPIGLHVTSPQPFFLQRLLRNIADQKIKYLVLECTSHGLAQNRFLGIRFEMAVITNVTSEHLDYHGTYSKYLEVKGKLFKKTKVVVLNRDDRSFSYLNTARSRNSRLVTYAVKKKAEFTPNTYRFKTPLIGEYNRYNCLAAIAVAKTLEIDDKTIRKSLAAFTGVTGRMEIIDLGQDFQVFVDFAHTPNGLQQALTALKEKSNERRIIAVFGCAGLRDFYKRPLMGEIAARIADVVILTAEDPRTEDVEKIIDQIAQGCLKGHLTYQSPTGINESQISKLKGVYFRISDRREAIRFAINKLACKNDIVAFFGKGHEASLCYGRIEKPWSEHEEIKTALRERLGNA
ncbi:MAG TPA: UDP-N-acetylmuramoyl-L-alanyl-D-glutamate--2,6-diaminopimelate ligase [Candidatus Bathyarchaeia archaeon]|nr:UDP-N-acetylmuramoyl-L-alanyl-D-glutamate--2,6-diaminopimelate ligase [Candidatus Bathyarchaeia archaeon]